MNEKNKREERDMLSQKEVDSKANLIQDMLDEGMSMYAIAKSLNINHNQVARTVSRMGLEIYQAFDEMDTEKKQYTDWDYEDVLDKWAQYAWDEVTVSLPANDDRNDPFKCGLYRYINETYGGWVEWTKTRCSGHEEYVTIPCGVCSENKSVSQYQVKRNSLSGIVTTCRKCKYDKADKEWFRTSCNKRRSAKKLMPSNWNISIRMLVMSDFKNQCTLTGINQDECDDDQFIPLATGHGGSYAGNLYPLSLQLNRSKHDKNPFEWFATNAERFGLDPARFEALVAKLAEQNGLTPEDFREYTYWCFANPRNLTQIKRDNTRYGYRVTSVELWREATGRSNETGNRLNVAI